jgi:hypothetical protein
MQACGRRLTKKAAKSTAKDFIVLPVKWQDLLIEAA